MCCAHKSVLFAGGPVCVCATRTNRSGRGACTEPRTTASAMLIGRRGRRPGTAALHGRVHRVCTHNRERKKRLPSPSPPADAVSHGKPDAPIRPDRRPFLRASTQSSPRATQGRSRGCKVRTAPEATSTHLVCIMRSSITIPRGGGQPGVAPSVWRFARYSPMPTPR